MFNEPISPILLLTAFAIAIWVLLDSMGLFEPRIPVHFNYMGPTDSCLEFLECQSL
jgi:hypothetical protein